MKNKFGQKAYSMFNCQPPFYFNNKLGWRVRGFRHWLPYEIINQPNRKDLGYCLWEENFCTEEEAQKFYNQCLEAAE